MAHILCIPLSRITHEARRSKRKQHNGDKLFLWREFFIIILSQLIPYESLMLGQLWDPISPPKLFMTKKLNMRWLFLWPVLQNMSKWTSMGRHPVLVYVLKFPSTGWRPHLCTQTSEKLAQYQWSIRYAAVFTRFLMMFIIIQVNKGRLRNLQRCQWQVSRVDNCPHRSWQNRRLCRALSFRKLLTPQIYVIEFGNHKILMLW